MSLGDLIQAPFELMKMHGDASKGDPAALCFFFGLFLLAAPIMIYESLKPDPPRKPPITERIGDAVKRPINRWKIDRAKKKYDEEKKLEEEKRKEMLKYRLVEEPDPKSWWGQQKEKLRKKLNKDHQEDHER